MCIKSVLEDTGRREEFKSALEVSYFPALEHDVIIPPHPTPQKSGQKAGGVLSAASQLQITAHQITKDNVGIATINHPPNDHRWVV